MEKILLLKDASNLLLRKLKEFIDKIENVETKKKHFLLDHSRAGNFEEDRFKEWMAHNLKTEVLDLNDDIKSIINLLPKISEILRNFLSTKELSSRFEPNLISIPLDSLKCPKCNAEILLNLRYKKDGQDPNPENILLEYVLKDVYS